MQSLQHITRHTSLSQKVSVQYFLRQKVHRRVKKIYCTELKNKKIYNNNNAKNINYVSCDGKRNCRRRLGESVTA